MLDETREAVRRQCESPIEQIVCVGLFLQLGCRAVEGAYHASRLSELAATCDAPAAFLFAQHKVEGYRLDFLLVAIDTAARKAWTMAIECDGRAYHTSPEQIAYDRHRDAVLDAKGIPTMRFDGSTIRGDTASFVERVGNWLRECGVEPAPLPQADMFSAYMTSRERNTRRAEERDRYWRQIEEEERAWNERGMDAI